MDRERDRFLLQIRAEIRAGDYRPDLDRVAAAALRVLTTRASVEERAAAIFLRDRFEKILVLLALAERGLHGACLEAGTPLDELIALEPAVVVADSAAARRSASLLRLAVPDTQLVVVGEPELATVVLLRPLQFERVQAAFQEVLPTRPARRKLARVLLVGEAGALAQALVHAKREVVRAADPVELFVNPPRGSFDVIFPGPELAADRKARAALYAIYGPGVAICPA